MMENPKKRSQFVWQNTKLVVHVCKTIQYEEIWVVMADETRRIRQANIHIFEAHKKASKLAPPPKKQTKQGWVPRKHFHCNAVLFHTNKARLDYIQSKWTSTLAWILQLRIQEFNLNFSTSIPTFNWVERGNLIRTWWHRFSEMQILGKKQEYWV